MTKRSITWNALAWEGTETCTIESDDTGVRIEGHLSGTTEENVPYELSYLLELAPDWTAQHVLVKDATDEGKFLDLVRENGRWLDPEGVHLTDFDSCDFVDITLTPLTNTLPIKNLQFVDKEPIALDVLYINLPECTIERKTQGYAKLGEHTYRFQQRGFSADIITDDDDLVVVYPGLFCEKSHKSS
jgi:uncharacterized protein